MGCCRFGERWASGPDDLMVEAFTEALADAGMERDRIDAAWLGVFFDEQSTGKSSLPLSMALRLPNVPTTRVENLCATGTEALRGAVYAVAAGACDIALAMGVEKLKDTGFGGLPERTKGTFEDLYLPSSTAPGAFAQLAERLRRALRLRHDGPEARHGAHLLQEPRERRAQSQGAPAQPHHRRNRCSMRRRSPIRSGFSIAAASATAPPAPSSPPRRLRAVSARRDLVSVKAHAARTQQRRRDGPSVLGREPYADHAA